MCTVYCILCTVYCVLYTVYCILYNVYNIAVYCERERAGRERERGREQGAARGRERGEIVFRFAAQAWRKIDPRSAQDCLVFGGKIVVRHLVRFLVELPLPFFSFHCFSFVVLFSCSMSFLVLSVGSHASHFRSCPPFVVFSFPSLLVLVLLGFVISVRFLSFILFIRVVLFLSFPLYCELYTVALCTVYCVLCAVYFVLYTVYYIVCTVYCILRTVCCILCTVYCVLYIVYRVLYTVYCALYCVLYTVHFVLCTVCCLLCTVVFLFVCFCVFEQTRQGCSEMAFQRGCV